MKAARRDLAVLRRIEKLGAPTYGEIGSSQRQMDKLVKAGLIVGRADSDGFRWRLTEAGREAAADGENKGD